MPGTWNLFAIARKGRERKEDQLTELLAWLIDAVPEVGRAVTGLAFPGATVDGPIQVTTQAGVAKGRLDALLVGSEFALVVESKIDSDFHDDQIIRYLDWLEQTQTHKALLGLMTPTDHPIAPKEGAKLDSRPSVVGSSHLWEELHNLLLGIEATATGDPLAQRLTEEFLEMLAEEDLIPMKPLEVQEYCDWQEACRTVRRFHDFLAQCVNAVGEALDAQTTTHSQADPSYFWQDYRLRASGALEGTRILFGAQATDEGRVQRSATRQAPLLFVAVEAKHWPDWPRAIDRLKHSVPDGWHYWDEMWNERPRIGRYLDEVLGSGTFDEQRDRLAAACTGAIGWLRGALESASAGDTPPGARLPYSE